MLSTFLKTCQDNPGLIDKATNQTLTWRLSSTIKVFELDELREKILKYVIFEGTKGKICEKMVKNMRLVAKSWVETTSRLLRKFGEPVVVISLDGSRPIENEEFSMQESLVYRQIATLSKMSTESYLPIKVDLKLDFFCEHNFQMLSNLLTGLGHVLQELQLEYPKTGSTLPVLFSSFTLPYLHKLSFQFSENILTSHSASGEEFGDNRNGLWLFQSILNASKVLTTLVVPFIQTGGVVPVDFKYLQLPVSITSLEISLILKNDDLDVLVKNQLPNLISLTLQLSQIPFKERMLFKILNNFRKTLQVFRLDGIESIGHPWETTYLQFPVMDKLKKITIASIECELGPGIVYDLQRQLPKLNVALLEHQSLLRLEKWTNNSKFENVLQLWISVVNEQLEEEHESFFVSISPQLLKNIRQAFPNIKYLGLTINISDLIVLKYLFANMCQLLSLSITFAGSEVVLDTSADLIDSTLLGLPLQLVVVVKENPDYLETIEFKKQEPSICNMSVLRTLILRNRMNNSGDPGHAIVVSLVSNLLFQHAFLKMASLQNLVLSRKFKPDQNMQHIWREKGRIMTYAEF